MCAGPRPPTPLCAWVCKAETPPPPMLRTYYVHSPLVALSSCVVYKTQTSSEFTGLNFVVHCSIDNYLQLLSVCQELILKQCNCNFLLTAMIYEITIYEQE